MDRGRFPGPHSDRSTHEIYGSGKASGGRSWFLGESKGTLENRKDFVECHQEQVQGGIGLIHVGG